MKKIMLMMAAALMMVACGSKKNVGPEGETLVVQYCDEYKTDATGIRAMAVEVSPDQQNAKEKAMMAARQTIANTIQVKMMAVAERYRTSVNIDGESDMQGRDQSLVRQITNQVMSGVYVVCDKLTKTTSPSGKTLYKSYIAMELGSEALRESFAKELDKAIDEAAKADLDFQRALFTEIFNEELKK